MSNPDVCYLVAVILFVIVAVWSLMKDNISGALYAAGLTAVALGLLLAP